MADESSDPESTEDDSDRRPEPRRQWWEAPAPVDPRLEYLVVCAELIGLQLHVSVTVGGRVITGRLGTAAEFFASQADAWDRVTGKNLPPDTGEVETALLGELARQARIHSGVAAAEALDLRDAKARPSYLHLSQARYLTGGQLVTQEGVPLRIRLDRVDAWTLVGLGEA